MYPLYRLYLIYPLDPTCLMDILDRNIHALRSPRCIGLQAPSSPCPGTRVPISFGLLDQLPQGFLAHHRPPTVCMRWATHLSVVLDSAVLARWVALCMG